MRSLLAIAVLFVFIFLSSCRPEAEPLSPELPPTPILTSDSTWGVANIPYLKMLQKRDISSGVDGLLREGDIVEILSKVGSGDGHSYWFEVRSEESRGWVQDSGLDIYDSRAQAATASAVLENGN